LLCFGSLAEFDEVLDVAHAVLTEWHTFIFKCFDHEAKAIEIFWDALLWLSRVSSGCCFAFDIEDIWE